MAEIYDLPECYKGEDLTTKGQGHDEAVPRTQGNANAKIIRDKKKAAQLTKGEDEPDYWTIHPELPDAEELLLILSLIIIYY